MSEYYGTKQLAEMTMKSQTTIRGWCVNGKFPTAEHDAKGSPWRVSKNDPYLIKYLSEMKKS